MLLATIILLIAALVLVIIGFILDRLAIRKLQSGMRKMYKRIKALETTEIYYTEVEHETADDGMAHSEDDE